MSKNRVDERFSDRFYRALIGASAVIVAALVSFCMPDVSDLVRVITGAVVAVVIIGTFIWLRRRRRFRQ